MNKDCDLAEDIMERLRNVLKRHLPREGLFTTAIPDVFVARRDHAGITEHRFDRPVVSLLAQGSKKTCIGSDEYLLQPGQLLTIGLDMPSSSLLVEATPAKPLMTLYFYLDQKIVGDLMLELGWSGSRAPNRTGVSVAWADADFLDGMFRLASLMEKPEQIPVRSRMILRELHYLLLVGPQKDVLLNLYGGGAYGRQVFAAIKYLKERLDAPVRAEELARAVHLCESSLYRHFKALTGMSPMQYHKQLRLHEARRLMLAENEQAALAAIRVGYGSVTQFNREYKRLFGQPPHRSKKNNQ